jgi:hypothetical protein
MRLSKKYLRKGRKSIKRTIKKRKYLSGGANDNSVGIKKLNELKKQEGTDQICDFIDKKCIDINYIFFSNEIMPLLKNATHYGKHGENTYYYYSDNFKETKEGDLFRLRLSREYIKN